MSIACLAAKNMGTEATLHVPAESRVGMTQQQGLQELES
jgi:hypothetical protein